jgi:hypothetical protein
MRRNGPADDPLARQPALGDIHWHFTPQRIDAH